MSNAEEFATLLGMASMALEFCHQPNIYPLLTEWLTDQYPAMSEPDEMFTQEEIRVAEIFITLWAKKLYKQVDDEASDKDNSGRADSTGTSRHNGRVASSIHTKSRSEHE